MTTTKTKYRPRENGMKCSPLVVQMQMNRDLCSFAVTQRQLELYS